MGVSSEERSGSHRRVLCSDGDFEIMRLALISHTLYDVGGEYRRHIWRLISGTLYFGVIPSSEVTGVINAWSREVA